MDFSQLKVQIGSRLSDFIASKSMNKTQFAEYINFNSGAVYSVLNGKNGLSMEMALAIKSKFSNLSLDWLFTGEGEMQVKENNIVMGDNNGSMQVHTASEELVMLRERTKSMEKEVEGLKEQLRLKDEIIQLLKK